MNQRVEKSANEIETLVFKAARGGGLPLGLAEDLAQASAFLDLEALATCPCHEGGAAYALSQALDMVRAGHSSQQVEADPELISAYVALAQLHTQNTLVWERTEAGAVFHRFEDAPPDAPKACGRRGLSPDLESHLIEMASKILVPETDASRLAGAGAGLSDND